MLDETLVLCPERAWPDAEVATCRAAAAITGRRPTRGLFAGGGVARGNVVGRSDKIAGTVADRPISPKDVLATIYHLLGIDPETLLPDRTGRPMPLVADGGVVPEMLA